ncbi:hypothetical protein APE_0416a [Aeropyrum pernix K1]|uniref:Uncharacterized protein n=1 Tax=Aeropyrum pernix (strain ATCC 700893 / DSM 11879 / JCM 9820 / NBRC 100138 / K1) TaxID=272557 RepID=Q9YF21_AERPE|nr:hypothetical protein APE_0416a [Aeropyrum pernix K1]
MLIPLGFKGFGACWGPGSFGGWCRRRDSNPGPPDLPGPQATSACGCLAGPYESGALPG